MQLHERMFAYSVLIFQNSFLKRKGVESDNLFIFSTEGSSKTLDINSFARISIELILERPWVEDFIAFPLKM